MKSLAALLFPLLILCAPALLAQQGRETPTTIILVRHAEKDTASYDPPLTARGRERARRLAVMLAASGVRSTHSTQYLRTRETVAPLDSLLAIANEVVEADRDSLGAHVAALVGHLLSAHRGETSVVASHSNVLPLILLALGVEPGITITDAEYDDLFIVTTGGTARPAFVRLQMGMQ